MGDIHHGNRSSRGQPRESGPERAQLQADAQDVQESKEEIAGCVHQYVLGGYPFTVERHIRRVGHERPGLSTRNRKLETRERATSRGTTEPMGTQSFGVLRRVASPKRKDLLLPATPNIVESILPRRFRGFDFEKWVNAANFLHNLYKIIGITPKGYDACRRVKSPETVNFL